MVGQRRSRRRGKEERATGLHRDEAVGGQDRGVKEDREGQEDQQCRNMWDFASFWVNGTRCLECEDVKLGARSIRLV